MPNQSYNTFYFKEYRIDTQNNEISFIYSFDNELPFETKYSLDLSSYKDGKVEKELIENAAFQLGMAEIPSYYKAYCPSKIVIECGNLSETQIAFWKEFYTKGLGEFFYNNKINFRNLFDIQVNTSLPILTSKKQSFEEYNPLVLCGGGKDSIVTGEIFKKNNQPFTWFIVHTSVGKQKKYSNELLHKVIKTSQNIHTEEVFRSLDPRIKEQNAQGAYNGHIPITGALSFAAVLVSVLKGYSDILTSNERSANIGNIEYLGMEINHQYSKSFAFEQLMNTYIKEHVHSDLAYKSFLRPWHELQIIQEFTKHKQYFPLFMSCNKGLQTGNWCNACPKCAFVYSCLHAFLDSAQVDEIFKESLYEKDSLFELYEELLGEKNFKPFECVGVPQEVKVAMYLSMKKYQDTLPYVLQQVKEQYLPKWENMEKKSLEVLSDFNKEHLLSSHEEEMIRSVM